MQDRGNLDLSRRDLMIVGAASATAAAVPSVGRAQAPMTGAAVISKLSFDVNGVPREL
jgi:hypothetical protein